MKTFEEKYEDILKKIPEDVRKDLIRAIQEHVTSLEVRLSLVSKIVDK